MKLAFVLDPLESIKTYKDSSYAMMREAARRGHSLAVLHQEDLVWKDRRVVAFTRALRITGDAHHWYDTGERTATAPESFDFVLMRKDPPFDMEYVYSTYLLELAQAQGARVVNDPRALRDFNEKLAITRFPQFTVPTLVARDEALIRAFLAEHGDIVLKPLDGMGGSSVFRLHRQDHNVGVVIETLTHYGRRTIMAQRFIPEISEGDRRVLVIGGEPVPYALARIPKPGETRGNLAAGGRGVAQPLTAREKEIALALGPELNKHGLMLVGLDVIGGWLTEVNVTSPTCMREIEDQTGFNVAGMMIDALERARTKAQGDEG
ncbi:MAG TPA: glutathione synthase [Burkholderiales bacterium]|jgi:glutathione synthase|nr:glutathione synthase [Burkholderiales bacterium]